MLVACGFFGEECETWNGLVQVLGAFWIFFAAFSGPTWSRWIAQNMIIIIIIW